MEKPRSFKSALEQDYIVKKIYAKFDKKIRVDMTPRFPHREKRDVCFWMDRDWFEKNYAEIYEQF